MRICHFEDRAVLQFEPLTLTRPVFDLWCGQSSLAAKQRQAFGPGAKSAYLMRSYLAPVYRLQNPIAVINDAVWLGQGPMLLVNGRWLPSGTPLPVPKDPCVGLIGKELAFAHVTPEMLEAYTGDNLDDCLETWKQELPSISAGGRLFNYLWEIVDQNGKQIVHDHKTRDTQSGTSEIWTGNSPAIIGPPERLVVHRSARVDPMVVVDTTRGPVIIEREAVVNAFSRLEGPCYIGAQTEIHGAKIRAGTTLGPQCRIGGEVEASIVQGYTNKYHDGFLGHAYVGEWVNLGAGTHNSDLRNDYGEVSVTVQGRLIRTGLTKVGCYLGDHTKTALGTLLNTGTSAGVFCNLLPAGLSPRSIPSFLWWVGGHLIERGDLGRCLETAAKVMRRRGVHCTEAHLEVYRQLYANTSEDRRRILVENEMRSLRLSA